MLKLYVWHDSCCDYTCGVMFALAESVESAREIIRETEERYDEQGLSDEPSIYESPMGCVVWGGG